MNSQPVVINCMLSLRCRGIANIKLKLAGLAHCGALRKLRGVQSLVYNRLPVEQRAT
jgi:hypothetical protein